MTAPTIGTAPVDDTITIPDLVRDPYAIYHRLRATTPIVHVPALGRTLLTRAADVRHAKDNPRTFSNNDPGTPMERAFQAHTLMRKDGAEHKRERDAMAPAFSPRLIRDHWQARYAQIAEDYIGRLPRGESVDLFTALAAPYSARVLAELLGIPSATDAQMIHWSQSLINGAGNFAWADEPFAITDAAHDEMNALFDAETARHRADPGPSALSVMVNAGDPIPTSQIRSNIKIAIGGGINEPRDALCTILYGLLTNPDQMRACRDDAGMISEAFEEGIRWVAPIQVSARLVLEDTELGGIALRKGEVVMTSQASAGHDEAVHTDGHLFDIFRDRKTHQSFGSGPHFCQGTHVARMMLTQIVIPMLLDRFPDMALTEPEAVIWHGFGFRGPLSLPVRLQ